MRDAWVVTYTGRRFWPLEPDAEEVDIVDIAHALSNVCRFNGHTRDFYSVAQHSVYVSNACDQADALWGLLHDASEAYLHDIVRPLKHLFRVGEAAYVDVESRIMRAVMRRFGLAEPMPESVRVADERVLATEKRDLLTDTGVAWARQMPQPLGCEIEAWEPRTAKRRFLATYAVLTGVEVDMYRAMGRESEQARYT